MGNFNICTFHLGFKGNMMTLSGDDNRERGKVMHIRVQCVPGGRDKTSGECSLC